MYAVYGFFFFEIVDRRKRISAVGHMPIVMHGNYAMYFLAIIWHGRICSAVEECRCLNIKYFKHVETYYIRFVEASLQNIALPNLKDIQLHSSRAFETTPDVVLGNVHHQRNKQHVF